jgi:hypothetical protein
LAAKGFSASSKMPSKLRCTYILSVRNPIGTLTPVLNVHRLLVGAPAPQTRRDVAEDPVDAPPTRILQATPIPTTRDSISRLGEPIGYEAHPHGLCLRRMARPDRSFTERPGVGEALSPSRFGRPAGQADRRPGSDTRSPRPRVRTPRVRASAALSLRGLGGTGGISGADRIRALASGRARTRHHRGDRLASRPRPFTS